MSVSRVILTADGYQEISCPGTTRVTLQISNAGVNIGFGEGPPPANYRDPDETWGPVTAGLGRSCDSIRIRSALSGTPATVYLTALTEED